MITIEEVIEFLDQDYYTGDNWEFVNNKEAAAVVRAQHEELEQLKRERDEAYERAAIACENERLSDPPQYADDEAYNSAIYDVAKAIRALKSGEPK